MIRHRQTFRALLESLDSLGSAKEPTAALLHCACSDFAEMIAQASGQQCAVLIGSIPITRNPARHARA
jgi:hypothetical protein